MSQHWARRTWQRLPIEPYWNWNKHKVWEYPSIAPPNRTILELKLVNFYFYRKASKTPNRTILELKLDTESVDGWRLYSQSNHTGIETWFLHNDGRRWSILPIEPYWNWNCKIWVIAQIVRQNSQSNHTGIETAFLWFKSCFNKNSQSNHTGIETDNLNKVSSPLSLLPIEPYWNWNDSAMFENFSFFFLPIEPYWNWNTDNSRGRFRDRTLPIEPYWNWNQHGFEINNWRGLLPIEPYWNWNTEISDVKSYVSLLPIEPYWNWNLLSISLTLVRCRLPIEPYWNWNYFGQSEFCTNPTSQSNHTGIETNMDLK